MFHAYYNSPIGKLLIISDKHNITELHIKGSRYYPKIASKSTENPKHPPLQKTITQLQEYFSGKRQQFDLPIKPHGTFFQTQVWQELLKISHGTTTSYKQISHQINNPKALRAVGTAIGKNPISIIIPCHRVISSNGSLNQYAAGLPCKKSLLILEKAI